MRLLVTAVAALVVAAAPSAAMAKKVTVDGTYEISIAGWGIARASVDFTLDKGRYDASIFMAPKGVAKIVTAVRTSVSASGRVRGSRVLPSKYRVRADEIDRPVAVDMRLRSGTVSRLNARPPLKRRRGRIPVTNRHKSNIVDPLSSGLIPIRTADARDACDRTLEIFDGWTRYDVRLYFKTTKPVSTSGFTGRAAVCGARWVPVAGHRPNRREVEYLKNNKRLEMTVVPVGNAGVAIPYEIEIGTPNGLIRIEPSRLVMSGPGV